MEARFVQNGNNPNGNLAFEIITITFLTITFTDFLIQSLVILYVYIKNIFEAKTIWKKVFGVFSALFFLFFRLSLLFIILKIFVKGLTPPLPSGIDLTINWYVTLLGIFGIYGVGVVFGIYYLLKYGVTGDKVRFSAIDDYNEDKSKISGDEQLPMVVFLMAIYNENSESLTRAVDSVFNAEYPGNRKHIFLSFDEVQETQLYYDLMNHLQIKPNQNSLQLSKGGPMFPVRVDFVIKNVQITISRFEHGGKNATQGQSFRIVQELYSSTSDNTLIFNLDSDVVIHPNSVYNFISRALRNPKMRAATGLMTCNTKKVMNIWQYLQNVEYIDGQLFARAGEAGLGAVTCLPGALSLIWMDALSEVAQNYYFEEDKVDSMSNLNFHKIRNGEDRYLTYLLIKAGKRPWEIQFIPNIRCRTDAPNTFFSLLEQRRRWFLGGLTCDIHMLSNLNIWVRFPFLQLFKLFTYGTRSIDWLFWIVLINYINNFDKIQEDLFLLLFPLLTLFKYLILVIFGFLSGMRKICLTYLVMVVLMPFFTLIVVIYSVFTWNRRSWGGPRTQSKNEGDEISQITIISKETNKD